MQPPYRSGPDAPTPRTIVYWGPSTALRLVFTVVFTLWLVLSCVLTFAMARTVTFECDRAAGACTIATRYSITPEFQETHPLSDIRGVKLTSTPGTRRKPPSYGVALEVGATTVSLSNRAGSFPQRDSQRREIDQFLKGQSPRLHLVYDEGSLGGVLGGLLFGAFGLLALWLIWQNTRVRVDTSARTVLVERRQWPLRSSTEAVPFGEVTGVEVRDERGRKGALLFQVALVRTTGADIPLLPQPTATRDRSEREAERLRSVLSDAGVDARHGRTP